VFFWVCTPRYDSERRSFAGIWDSWKRLDGTRLETFALITTEPNELVAQIHDRLALILHPRDYDRWLGIDGRGGDPRPPPDLLHPYDADKMVMKPANPAGSTSIYARNLSRPSEARY
jgi:putative SOS response-associated peptidase YedK